MKKAIAMFVALFIFLTALPMNVFADSSGIENLTADSQIPISQGTMSLNEDDIFISEDEATIIAQYFINDIIAAGMSTWDENTIIVSVKPLYDQTSRDIINAYSVELNSGYIIISAYLGMENIIIEWSDIATPTYKLMDFDEEDKVVYLGPLAYYKDSGNATLEAPDGETILKSEIDNKLEYARNVNNVPEYLLTYLTEDSQQPSASVCATIPEPYRHANAHYQGPFKYYEHINRWDSSSAHLSVIDMSSFNCKNHCGPTAVTNMLRMYGNRFNISSIKSDTNSDLFGSVLWIGNCKYYFNADIDLGVITLGGTFNSLAGSYIKDCFDEYGLTANCTRKDINYNNIKYSLSRDYLLYLMVNNHSTYGNHHMVCYAYTRLISETTGLYKTYLKVADGWDTRPKYVDLATVTSDTYWEARISR